MVSWVDTNTFLYSCDLIMLRRLYICSWSMWPTKAVIWKLIQSKVLNMASWARYIHIQLLSMQTISGHKSFSKKTFIEFFDFIELCQVRKWDDFSYLTIVEREISTLVWSLAINTYLEVLKKRYILFLSLGIYLLPDR